MRRRSSMLIECPRCGQQQHVERAGRFRDEDYLELWHEHCEMQAEHRGALARAHRDLIAARRDIEYLRSLLEHLDLFLPSDMQNPELRARHPEAYRAIAEHLAEAAVEEVDPFAQEA